MEQIRIEDHSSSGSERGNEPGAGRGIKSCLLEIGEWIGKAIQGRVLRKWTLAPKIAIIQATEPSSYNDVATGLRCLPFRTLL